MRTLDNTRLLGTEVEEVVANLETLLGGEIETFKRTTETLYDEVFALYLSLCNQYGSVKSSILSKYLSQR